MRSKLAACCSAHQVGPCRQVNRHKTKSGRCSFRRCYLRRHNPPHTPDLAHWSSHFFIAIFIAIAYSRRLCTPSNSITSTSSSSRGCVFLLLTYGGSLHSIQLRDLILVQGACVLLLCKSLLLSRRPRDLGAKSDDPSQDPAVPSQHLTMSSPTESGGANAPDEHHVALGNMSNNNSNDTSTAVTVLPGRESLTEFHPFPRLPIELRFEIWEHAILSHHRDRLVPISSVDHAYTDADLSAKRIICHPSLGCSPHFSASRESRDVAKRLYPIELLVCRVVHETILEEDENGTTIPEIEVGPTSPGGTRWGDDESHPARMPLRRPGEGPRLVHKKSVYEWPGRIFLSARHDIFVFDHPLDRKLQAEMPRAYGSPTQLVGWQSVVPSPADFRDVRRAMLYISEIDFGYNLPVPGLSLACCKYWSSQRSPSCIVNDLPNVQFIFCVFSDWSRPPITRRLNDPIPDMNEFRNVSRHNPSAHTELMGLVEDDNMICFPRQELNAARECLKRTLATKKTNVLTLQEWYTIKCTCPRQERRLAYHN
ncbi:hypothetical protein GGR57DRAFT_481864 [Xylariaceae sp. FL1272]|nr:hypothetical protein GGR57DRAFT_481864 [Xylariaceae sp. FL1272]